MHDLDIRMTGEDFSYFANEIPGCLSVGHRLTGAQRLGTHGLHTPRFDVDEEALKAERG